MRRVEPTNRRFPADRCLAALSRSAPPGVPIGSDLSQPPPRCSCRLVDHRPVDVEQFLDARRAHYRDMPTVVQFLRFAPARSEIALRRRVDVNQAA